MVIKLVNLKSSKESTSSLEDQKNLNLNQNGFSVVNENFKNYDDLSKLPDLNSMNSKMLEYINQNQNDVANVSGEYIPYNQVTTLQPINNTKFNISSYIFIFNIQF